MMDASEVEAAVGTTAYKGALLDMRGGHIHPLKLALGEAAAVTALGGQIFEQSGVTRLEKGANPVAHTEKRQRKSEIHRSCG